MSMNDDVASQNLPGTQEGTKMEDSNAPINIKVLSAGGEEVFFKIKRSTKLSKLQGAYASKVGKDVNTIRFLYDGERINEDDTPASLGMEDNDTIDVMVEREPSLWRLVYSSSTLHPLTLVSEVGGECPRSR